MPSKKKRQPAQDVAATSRRARKPEFITPMAALAVPKLPAGKEWTYELKLDGYRALLIKDHDRFELRSRKDKDLTRMYRAVAATARRLKAERAVVDGEIVALDVRGRPSFQALQHRGTHPKHTLVFYAFDLLHLNGEGLANLPLEVRRARLPPVIEDSGVLLSKELPGAVNDIVESVRALGLEGVVAKRKGSIYVP